MDLQDRRNTLTVVVGGDWHRWVGQKDLLGAQTFSCTNRDVLVCGHAR